jgi:hypothetical protein
VIGAMRSGTSALGSYLRPHPEVFIPAEDEVHFFDSKFERGLDWYKSRFRMASDEVAVGETTATYLYYEPAIERMASIVPDVRLIAILRNPVDRAYSHYWLNRARGLETLPFADAIHAEDGRLAHADWRTHFGKSYVDRGRYLPQLLNVVRRFPRNNVHVLLFDDLRDQPTAAYASICRFLRVDASFIPTHLGQQVFGYREYRSPILHRASRYLPVSIRRRVRRVNSVKAQYPAMDSDIRSELLARFAEHNEALAEWLGRDLSCWST